MDDLRTLVDRIEEQARRSQEALLSQLHAIVGGNPGSLFAAFAMHQTNAMSLEELVPLLRDLGLVNSAFYLLHKEFGGKDAALTAANLRVLQANSGAVLPLTRGRGDRPAVTYCVDEMRRYE